MIAAVERPGMRPAVGHDDVTERGAIVTGNEVRYLHADGEGPPVVLLHGGIVDAAHLSWGSAIGPLAAEHEVYAPDLLGYGRSDAPSGPYTTQRHVDAIVSFLDVVGLDAVDLVGTSLGGGVALGIALQQPDRVRRLVTASSFGLGADLPNGWRTFALSRLGVLNRAGVAIARRSRSVAESSLENVVTDADDLPDELVDAFLEELRRPHAGQAYRSWRKHEVRWGGWRTFFTPRLDELQAPALFVHGADDEIFPAEWSERAAERAPDGEAAVLEDCDHWVPRDAPERFEELTVEFLAE